MKKLRYIEIVMTVLALALAGAGLWKGSVLILVLGAVQGAVSVILLWLTLQEEKIENYLITQVREKPKTVKWDENEIEQLELLRRRSDFSALQYQINPHFLYNTLDTIRAHALLDGKEDIAAMTEKLSRFFRYAISNRDNLVRIEEETAHIKDYYYIQKQRFGDRFEMEIDMESEQIGQYYLPKLTLQPLIENAITHGLEKVRRKGTVCIRLYETQSTVVIAVIDNGAGMTEDALFALNARLKDSKIRVPTRTGRNNGIAIQNVNARIRLTFGEEYGIHYRSAQGEGTSAVVTIPKVDDFTRSKYEIQEQGQVS